MDIFDLMFEAVTLAKMVTPEQLDKGMLYPPMEQIRDISAHIAASVAKVAYDNGKWVHFVEITCFPQAWD